MQYKGYVGSVEFSEADGLFFGKVLGIRALISYEGTNAAELVADFHGAVDDYLSLCEAENSEPEKAYFNCHTDITIPYSELGDIVVHTENDEKITIIKNGRFVLEGTEALNEVFED